MDASGGFSITAQSRLAAFFALFMGLVIAVFIATGLTLAYAPPEYPQYPTFGPGGIDRAAQRQFDEELAEYRELNETRSIVLGVLGLALGTAVAAAGLASERRLGVLANGLVMGGLFTLVWANARFLYQFDSAYADDSRLLAAVIAGILSVAIFIGVGWWKFVRDLAPQDIDAGSRKQLHGIYTLLLAAALVYAFVLIWMYATTPIDTYPDDAYAGEALMYAIYSLVYSTALVSVGLALGGKRLGPLSGGFVFAGFAGLLSSVVGALMDSGNVAIKFVFVTLALGVTVAAGYLRFIRRQKGTPAEAPNIEVALPAEMPSAALAPRVSVDPFEAARPLAIGHLAAEPGRALVWDPRTASFTLGDEQLPAARLAELHASGALLWYPDVIAARSDAAMALRSALAG